MMSIQVIAEPELERIGGLYRSGQKTDPVVFMVVPSALGKAPYMAYHNGENFVMLLGVPINDFGQPVVDTRPSWSYDRNGPGITPLGGDRARNHMDDPELYGDAGTMH